MSAPIDNLKPVRLTDLVTNPKNDIVDGPFGSRLKASEYVEAGVPIVRLQNIDRNRFIDKNIKFVTEAKAKEIARHHFVSGDILISKLGDPLGEACIAPDYLSYGILVADVIRVRPNRNRVDTNYLAYALNSASVVAQFTAETKGTTRPRVNLNKVRDLEIPVAESISEQRRIVAEIEKQFTRLEAGVAALRRVQANLKRYRAAVLKAACEGRLVPTETSAWKQLTVSDIGEAITGNTPPTSDKENLGDELPFFKPTDLDAGYNVHLARQYLSAKGAKQARVLPAGAILVTCIGATIGKTGFARVDCATNQQINALVVNPKIAIPGWAFWSFSSPLGQQQIKGNASATTLPILNKSKFEALIFAVPPLAEQTRIVAEVERRLSVVEELESVVTANLVRSQRLRQSILQKAFSGGLA